MPQPNEFKKIPIPYQSINPSTFKEYTTAFEKKGSIVDVLNQNDYAILNNLGLASDEMERLKFIHKKLIDKRQRK